MKAIDQKGRRAISIDICLHSKFFKWDPHPAVVVVVEEEDVGGLFSKKDWHRKSGSA